MQNSDITFLEFGIWVDTEGHPRGWKHRAYEVFCRGETAVFYPLEPGNYKWRMDGARRVWEGCICDGTRDDSSFVVQRVIPILPDRELRQLFFERERRRGDYGV